MSIDWFLAQLEENYGKESFWLPTIIILLILSGVFYFRHILWKVLKSYPKYFLGTLFISFIGTVILFYNFHIWKHLIIYVIGGCLTVLSLLTILAIYLYMQRSLKKVIALFKAKNIDD